MNVGNAIARAKSGDRITRDALGPDTWVFVVPGPFLGKESREVLVLRAGTKIVDPDWSPTQEDALATDWRVLKTEPVSPVMPQVEEDHSFLVREVTVEPELVETVKSTADRTYSCGYYEARELKDPLREEPVVPKWMIVFLISMVILVLIALTTLGPDAYRIWSRSLERLSSSLLHSQ